MRTSVIRRAALPVLAAAALLSAAVPAHAQAAELRIATYHQDAVREWVLTCAPVGGSHPDPAAACDRLDEIGGDLDRIRPRPNVPCPRIYDPVAVRIEGHVFGEFKSFRDVYPNPCFVERLAAPIVP